MSENALTAVFSVIPDYNTDECGVYLDWCRRECTDCGYLGQKKQDEANTTVTHGLLLAFGIGALLNLLSLLIMKPYFRAFTNNEEIYQLSIAYMSVCSFMQIPNMVAYRNPEDDTGHREHDSSHVVSNCGRDGQLLCSTPS